SVRPVLRMMAYQSAKDKICSTEPSQSLAWAVGRNRRSARTTRQPPPLIFCIGLPRIGNTEIYAQVESEKTAYYLPGVLALLARLLPTPKLRQATGSHTRNLPGSPLLRNQPGILAGVVAQGASTAHGAAPVVHRPHADGIHLLTDRTKFRRRHERAQSGHPQRLRARSV